ncbi:AbrB/MazE/SpoVT family DNA-binding domain-containing protein [Steroidobacter flavus]|uniref:AbrB/MazE/SpoVT family DNA-binding domain-containing protein n=1 Tax=Steroidobacter flavus TaxID=1842136 RepID=A0ABV8SSS9_9GAMM
MTTVTVSLRFQVIIPPAIRKALGIKPGQRIQVLQNQDRIELIPLRPMRKPRAVLRASSAVDVGAKN